MCNNCNERRCHCKWEKFKKLVTGKLKACKAYIKKLEVDELHVKNSTFEKVTADEGHFGLVTSSQNVIITGTQPTEAAEVQSRNVGFSTPESGCLITDFVDCNQDAQVKGKLYAQSLAVGGVPSINAKLEELEKRICCLEASIYDCEDCDNCEECEDCDSYIL